jgi:ABC-type multidrug transport system ATPase subunit
MTITTPDALWGAPGVRELRPAAVAWTDLRRGSLLRGCSLAVPVGARLLVASDPPAAGSLLLRILAGLSPTRYGSIEIAGSADPSSAGWGRRVAYLGAEPGIRTWMTPREALRLTADLLSLAPNAAARRMEEVLAWVRIPPADLDRRVGGGDTAIAQRTGLASALLGDPEVLLLDEPLRAIDPAERTRLLRFPGARRTVLLASRDPSAEAGLVSHVSLLRGGRVALVASVTELHAAGLPLSMEGIAALAGQRQPSVRPGTPAPTAVAAR